MSKFQNFNYTDKEEKGVTIRNPQSAYLLLDSQDRYNLTSNGDYDEIPETSPNNIIINHQRNLGAGQIRRVAITEFSFPWTTPNVNETNNKLYIRDISSGVNYYIIVPEEFYTPSELADEITSILTTQGWINNSTGLPDISYNAPWACSVDTIGRFRLTANISGSPWVVQPPNDAVNKLAVLMNIEGYLSQPSELLPVSYIIGGIPSMAYTKYIDVCSKTLTKFQNLKDSLTQLNYSDVICRIYLENSINTPTSDTSYFGSRPCVSLTKQIQCPKYMLWNENEMINVIDIQLYDDEGKLLYIPMSNWSLSYFLTIQLSES